MHSRWTALRLLGCHTHHAMHLELFVLRALPPPTDQPGTPTHHTEANTLPTLLLHFASDHQPQDRKRALATAALDARDSAAARAARAADMRLLMAL